MSPSAPDGRRPAYDAFTDFEATRARAADAFARQILATAGPRLPASLAEIDVVDIGSGYGHTAVELARTCRSVVGIEPATDLHERAMVVTATVDNIELRNDGVEDLCDVEAFDLAVLDNVYEHLPDQEVALERVSVALRPGGVFYLLVPNRWWPIEVHYKLPFLSWLPLPLANAYLRRSGRGTDYTDASYAPSLRSLRRALDARPELKWELVLPGDPTAMKAGAPLHYRVGMRALEHAPFLWAASKAFLVVGTKEPERH